MTDAALKQRLAALLGPKGYSADPELIAPHLQEWRGNFHGVSDFLALPASTGEISEIVKLCAAAGVSITPQGGNTGMVAGQTPNGGILLCLRRMNAVRAVDADNDSIIAEAGLILENLHEVAKAHNRAFPLSLASQGSATIGGLISTNAGGVHVMRYGMMRDLVLGLEVVLPDGRVLNALKSLRKDNTGYDVKQLFIGAEGTLGIVAAASLKLFPRPASHLVAMAQTASAALALKVLERLKAQTGALVAFEILNALSASLCAANVPKMRDPFAGAGGFRLLMEFESADDALAERALHALNSCIQAGLLADAMIAQDETQARAFWALRENISAAHRVEGAQANLDISVPVSAVPDYIARAEALGQQIAPGARLVAFGHMGDGNIHTAILQPKNASAADFLQHKPAIIEAVQRLATELGGSISAEHGIGQARRAELPLYKDAVALSLMKTLKAALDPQRIMNPSAMLQAE